jgi:hypothetical protein
MSYKELKIIFCVFSKHLVFWLLFDIVFNKTREIL